MTGPRAATCPQCGRPLVSHAATPFLASGLCPACLFATAASMDDEECPYRVLAPIEQDGQGITYLAERCASSVRGYVALKVVAGGDGEAIVSRFHELRPALGRLHHPGAGKVLDAGSTADGSVYVASEYVAGTTLSETASRQLLDRGQRSAIARQLTEIVGAAHAAGVVHLDLDRSKVRVATAGALRGSITGFGLSVIVAGRAGSPDRDLVALDALIREFDL